MPEMDSLPRIRSLATSASSDGVLPEGSYAGAGVGAEARTAPGYDRIAFTLAVTSVAQDGGGVPATVRVWIQQTFDGSAWDDVIRFPDVTAPGRWTARAFPEGGRTEGIHQWLDGGLAADTVRDLLLGTRFRVKYDISGGGGSAAFSVTAYVIFPGRE
ncbi:MAG: hypothetical protein HY320_08935 [Armatimonadetes bacterium]|nr:hypothetical protein [Armatimonadota bacterium]